MSRILVVFNFLGVVALAVLCAIQWQANSRLTQEVDRLTATSQDQATKLADQDKTIKGNASDLDDLHKRLTTAEDSLKDTQTKLAAAENERTQAIKLRDQWKSAIDTKWAPALGQRDQYIHELQDTIQKLGVNRDEAVAQVKDITNRYNALVQQINNQGKNGHG